MKKIQLSTMYGVMKNKEVATMTIRDLAIMCGNIDLGTVIRIWDKKKNMIIARAPYGSLPFEFKNLKVDCFDFDKGLAECFIIV